MLKNNHNKSSDNDASKTENSSNSDGSDAFSENMLREQMMTHGKKGKDADVMQDFTS